MMGGFLVTDNRVLSSIACYVPSLAPLNQLTRSAALCFATLALLARYIDGIHHSLRSLPHGTVYGMTTNLASGGPNFSSTP